MRPDHPVRLPDVVSVACRLVVGGVWVVAGALKLPDPAENVRAVRAYDLLPESAVTAVGHGLPILELLVGACFLVGLLTRPVAALSALLQLAFVVGIASAWARGLSIDCGCFGGGTDPGANAAAAYPWDIARDVGLMAASLWLVVRPGWWTVDALVLGPGGRDKYEHEYDEHVYDEHETSTRTTGDRRS